MAESALALGYRSPISSVGDNLNSWLSIAEPLQIADTRRSFNHDERSSFLRTGSCEARSVLLTAKCGVPVYLSELYGPPFRRAPAKTVPEPAGKCAQRRETQHARNFVQRTLTLFYQSVDHICTNCIENCRVRLSFTGEAAVYGPAIYPQMFRKTLR